MLIRRVVVVALTMLVTVSVAQAQGSGVIKGVAKWDGKMMKRKPIQTTADPNCAKMYKNSPLLTEKLIINDNDTVRNVFVYVKSGLPDGKTWPVPSEPVVLDQKGCHYEPHVFGIMAGQELLIRNSDGTAHNINAQPKNNNPFNLGQPQKGMETKKMFANAELMVPFKCDVHNWMNAYCAVMDHPFFAVTNEKGEFEITGLPSGTYTLETWHEHKKLGSQTLEVEVVDGGEATAEFVFKGPKKKN